MTDKIYIFDTTLRDGEQSPGASMNLEEKVQIAEILEEMNVDIIPIPRKLTIFFIIIRHNILR